MHVCKNTQLTNVNETVDGDIATMCRVHFRYISKLNEQLVFYIDHGNVLVSGN